MSLVQIPLTLRHVQESQEIPPQKMWRAIQTRFPEFADMAVPPVLIYNTYNVYLGWSSEDVCEFFIGGHPTNWDLKIYSLEMNIRWRNFCLYQMWLSLNNVFLSLKNLKVAYLEPTKEPNVYLKRDLPGYSAIPKVDSIYVGKDLYKKLASSPPLTPYGLVVGDSLYSSDCLCSSLDQLKSWFKRYPLKMFKQGLLLDLFEFGPPKPLFSKFPIKSE